MWVRLFILMALVGGCGGRHETLPVTETPAKGRRVVFVVEATGDMMKWYFAVREYLCYRIDQLGDGDEFNMVFARAEGIEVLSERGLIRATEKSAKDAVNRIDVAHGAGDIRPAISKAIEMAPDEICLILDGWSSGAVLRDFRPVTSVGKRIRYDVVSFDGDALEDLRVLKRIAVDTGGSLINVARGDNELEKLGLSGWMDRKGNLTRSMVIVFDSVDMINVLDEKRMFARRAIDAMEKGASFGIICYSPHGYSSFEKGLVEAVPTSKRAAYDWLDKAGDPPLHVADPIEGLRAAFMLKPKVIYFLVEHKFENARAIRAAIRSMNSEGQTRVDTYSFDRPPWVDEGEEADPEFLRKIAEENGGRFRVYDVDR